MSIVRGYAWPALINSTVEPQIVGDDDVVCIFYSPNKSKTVELIYCITAILGIEEKERNDMIKRYYSPQYDIYDMPGPICIRITTGEKPENTVEHMGSRGFYYLGDDGDVRAMRAILKKGKSNE